MDEAWLQGETHLPAHPDPPQTDRGGTVSAQTSHACTHAGADAFKPPASIFHYYNRISWRQGCVVLRRRSQRLSASGGLSMTLGLKHESLLKRAGKTQRGAGVVQGALWFSTRLCAGAQLCPVQVQTHKDKYILTQAHKPRQGVMWSGCDLASRRLSKWWICISGAANVTCRSIPFTMKDVIHM